MTEAGNQLGALLGGLLGGSVGFLIAGWRVAEEAHVDFRELGELFDLVVAVSQAEMEHGGMLLAVIPIFIGAILGGMCGYGRNLGGVSS